MSKEIYVGAILNKKKTKNGIVEAPPAMGAFCENGVAPRSL